MAEYIVEDSSPSVWREQVVRCRDCYYYNSAWWMRNADSKRARPMDCYGVDPNGFCSWGKPKGGD